MFIDETPNKANKNKLSSWKTKDLSGYKFGMLTYHKRLNRHRHIWWTRCVCGRDVLSLPPHRFYRGEPFKTSCGCSGGLSQDYQSMPLAPFIKLFHFNTERLQTLYDIWVEQVISPALKKDNKRWYTQNGINHCVVDWFSFYSFVEDVGFPPEESRTIKKISLVDPFGPSNFYWSRTEVSTVKPNMNKYIFNYQGSKKERLASVYQEIDNLGSLDPYDLY